MPTRTSHSRRILAGLAEPLAALLRAATIADDETTRTAVVTRSRRSELLDAVLPMLKLAYRWSERERTTSGAQELAVPVRRGPPRASGDPLQV